VQVLSAPSVPWKKIAFSRAVWAISIANFCSNWGSYTLLTSLPLFLKDGIGFDIAQVDYIDFMINTN